MTGTQLDVLVDRYRVPVERAMARALPAGSGALARLHDAMRYSLESGGKRIRPVMCFAAAEAGGGEAAVSRAEAPAAALELIHTYSLIHDDLPCMDDDDFRRGQPSNHRVFGEGLAVLAGDGLLTRAFGVLAEAEELPAAIRVAMTAELAGAAGSLGMVGGQAADLEAEGADGIDLPTLQFIHTHKTGALFAASCRLGAMAVGAGDDAVQRLGRLGEKLGLAFQIVDDLLDATGHTETLGKASGRDRERGKATYPGLLGVEESRRRVTQLTEAAADLAGGFGPAGDCLAGLVRFVAERAR